MQVVKDLSKISILLIWVALIVIAAIAVHFYITYATPRCLGQGQLHNSTHTAATRP
jgi:hypothetical protein